MNAAKDDDIRRSLRCLHTQTEGIPYKVSNLLNLTDLVVMSEDDSILFLLEAEDLGDKISGIGWGGIHEEEKEKPKDKT
jgi:hypothetical protein